MAVCRSYQSLDIRLCNRSTSHPCSSVARCIVGTGVVTCSLVLGGCTRPTVAIRHKPLDPSVGRLTLANRPRACPLSLFRVSHLHVNKNANKMPLGNSISRAKRLFRPPPRRHNAIKPNGNVANKFQIHSVRISRLAPRPDGPPEVPHSMHRDHRRECAEDPEPRRENGWPRASPRSRQSA